MSGMPKLYSTGCYTPPTVTQYSTLTRMYALTDTHTHTHTSTCARIHSCSKLPPTVVDIQNYKHMYTHTQMHTHINFLNYIIITNNEATNINESQY